MVVLVVVMSITPASLATSPRSCGTAPGCNSCAGVRASPPLFDAADASGRYLGRGHGVADRGGRQHRRSGADRPVRACRALDGAAVGTSAHLHRGAGRRPGGHPRPRDGAPGLRAGGRAAGNGRWRRPPVPHAELDAATASTRETHMAAVRADLAAARSQATIDGIARRCTRRAAPVPSLVDVMLTADSELGLARSLVTRQYLASAGDRVVQWADLADSARQQAAASLGGRTCGARRAPAPRSVLADSVGRRVRGDVGAALADVDEARDRPTASS